MQIIFSEYIDKLNKLLFQFMSCSGIDIDKAVKLIVEQSKIGNKVIIIGNGGSASIASHFAIDLWKNANIKATSYSDSALITCISNDFGYEQVFEKPIEMFADPGDVLVAVSSSGMSGNIINGVEAAIRKECKIITMSGFKQNNILKTMGDINLYIQSESYGHVELAHAAFCHYISDAIVVE